MSMTISTDINRLKDLLNELLMPQKFRVAISSGYRQRKLTLVELLFQLSLPSLLKGSFQNHCGL